MSRDALVAVAQHSRARESAQLVAFRLADHTNRTGWAWPSVATLVEETGFSKPTVLRALAWLETAGELFIERGRNRRGNRYRLRLPGIPGNDRREAPDEALETVTPVDRFSPVDEDGNGPITASERSHRRPETVTPVDRNLKNQWNPSAAPTRVVVTRSACEVCGGSLWVDSKEQPGTVEPCPRCS